VQKCHLHIKYPFRQTLCAKPELGKEFGYTLHIRPRKEEEQAIKWQVGFKARRWVVERTHSWMNRFRGVLILWEKKIENYLGLSISLVLLLLTVLRTYWDRLLVYQKGSF